MKKYWLRIRERHVKCNKFLYLFITFIVLIMIWPFTCVDLGYKMVTYNSINGKFSVKNEGVNFTVPFLEEKIVYPITEQVYTISRDTDNWAKGIDGSIQIQTQDSQTISIDVSVIYHLDEKKLVDIYTYFNGAKISDIEEEHIKLFLKNIMNNIASNYTLDEVYGQRRSDFETEVFQQLQSQMGIYHIEISKVLIDTIRISEIYQELLNARVNAEKNLIEANNTREINRILDETLTSNIVQYESLKELNDNVRIIVVPSGSNGQLNLGELYTNILSEE